MPEGVLEKATNAGQQVEKVPFSAKISKFRELGLLLFILLLSVLIQFRNPRFLTIENINDLVTNTAILSILALGMMVVLITRGIDLSIGAVIAISGMITAQTISTHPNLNPVMAILLGTAIGIICGIVTGFLVSRIGL